MAVTGTITTHFKDEDGVDLGKQLVEKDYLIDLYPNLFEEFRTAGLFLWGWHADGKLGINLAGAQRSSPVQTASGSNNWTECATGTDFSLAIKSDGTLWCWGDNLRGQLGNNTVTHRSSPIQTIAFGTNWKVCAGGPLTSFAIKTDGTLWSWGSGTNGVLGNNAITHRSSPAQTVAFGTNWKSVAAGAHALAIKTDGTLWCWGLNNVGQLGDNTRTHRSSPVQVVGFATNWKQVSAGYRTSGGVKTDGTLWMWGEGADGRLGRDSTADASSPVQTIAFGTNWKQVACGFRHTGAVKTDGTLWMWGLNIDGNLGTNDLVHRSSPIQTIAYGNNWKNVACKASYTIATKTDGTLWGWGLNTYGFLGDNSSIPKSSPVQVGSLNTWKKLGIQNSGNGANHMTAILDFNY